MPSPKSGKAGSAVSPADPTAALEADNADPGEVEKVKAQQAQTQTGKYGAGQTKPNKPPLDSSQNSSQTDADKASKPSWIEIKLVGEDGLPIPGEPYQITLPDQSVAQGTLDEKGFARVDGIVPDGTCQITFPERDAGAWKKA